MSANPSPTANTPPMPPRAASPIGLKVPDTNVVLALTRLDRMVWIQGGTFLMGAEHYYPEEAPQREVNVDGFWIDPTPVTNAKFASFLEATNYITVAERYANSIKYPKARAGLTAEGALVFAKPPHKVDMANSSNWWRFVRGADWRHPMGPKSSIDGRENHPVVQLAYEDVEAYCLWAGKDLPTEAEWEFAARGGLADADYAWGDEFEPNDQIMANTWQGEFPMENLVRDGFEETSPVGSFPPNGYGLFDMIGNVWEWTSDSYEERPEDSKVSSSMPRKTVKGGSYLCAPNYNQRYRPAARMAQPICTCTCDLGFRCVSRGSVGTDTKSA